MTAEHVRVVDCVSTSTIRSTQEPTCTRARSPSDAATQRFLDDACTIVEL